jgi:hypothetical protein
MATTVVSDGKTYTLPEFDDLYAREIIAIESALGVPVEKIDSVSNTLSLTALLWIARRREEPSLKFDDVDFRVSDISGDDDEDETEAEKPTPPKKRAASKAS